MLRFHFLTSGDGLRLRVYRGRAKERIALPGGICLNQVYGSQTKTISGRRRQLRR
jgi:hypothetical protein